MSTGGLTNLTPNPGVLPRFVDPCAFIGRALMTYIFIIDGYGQIGNYSDVAVYMQNHGVTSLLLPLVILTELGGGLMILSGLMTRWAAIALAGYAILTALLFHSDGADIEQTINFQKNLAIAGGFFILAAFGPGAWSLDSWRARGVTRTRAN